MQPQYCSSPKELTMIGSARVPAAKSMSVADSYSCHWFQNENKGSECDQDIAILLSLAPVQADVGGFIPSREASSGFISKMSMPCIFPSISNRSRPVD